MPSGLGLVAWGQGAQVEGGHMARVTWGKRKVIEDLLYVLVHYNQVIDNDVARTATFKAQAAATRLLRRAKHEQTAV